MAALDEWFAAEYTVRIDAADDWGAERDRKQAVADGRRKALAEIIISGPFCIDEGCPQHGTLHMCRVTVAS